MAEIFGVDYAWGRPGVAALTKAKVTFVCRYLSHDTSGKSLTLDEVKQLTAAGIWIVVVWESTANRALVGRVGGVQDAKDAAAQAKACGMPDDRPIYFAVDWDANQAQTVRINAYLDGAASVLGVDRVGIYGGYEPVRRALDGGHATWGWQTYGWSGGRWDERAQLQQYLNDQTINGVGLDFDRATTDDYGQWKIGESPMALSDADLKKIADAVWRRDEIPSNDPNNKTWQAQSFLTGLDAQSTALTKGMADVAANLRTNFALLLARSPDVDESAIVKGVLAGLSPAAIAAAVVAALPADEAKQVADELAARLAA